MGKFYQYNDNIEAKVDWRSANQSTALAWRKKGLQDGGRDLKFRKFMFYGTAIVYAIGLLILCYPLLFRFGFSFKIILGIFIIYPLMFSFFIGMLYIGMLGGDVFNYRLTDTSFEQANWSDTVPFIKKIIQIPLILAAIAMVFVMLLNPAAILGVGLGGMVGIGLITGATIYSKGYDEKHLNFEFFSTDWSLMAHRVEIDKKRRIVVFWSENLNHKKHNIAQFSVFCTKQNFEQVSQIIINNARQKQLPINYKEVFTGG